MLDPTRLVCVCLGGNRATNQYLFSQNFGKCQGNKSKNKKSVWECTQLFFFLSSYSKSKTHWYNTAYTNTIGCKKIPSLRHEYPISWTSISPNTPGRTPWKQLWYSTMFSHFSKYSARVSEERHGNKSRTIKETYTRVVCHIWELSCV